MKLKIKFTAKEILKNLLLLAVLTYAGVVGTLYVIQDYLVFRNYGGAPNLAATNLPRLQEIEIPIFLCADSAQDCAQSQLLSWYTPPVKPEMPTILYLHGNGGNIAKRPGIAAQFLQQGWGLFMLEYRGYGGNPGHPSADGLAADAKAAYDYLRRQLGDNAKIQIYGESIGGAVAIKMIAANPNVKIDGLVLYAPFTKLSDVVKYLHPWMPVDLILRNDFDNISGIKTMRVPVLVMHGELDDFVPPFMGRAIFNAANEPKELWIDPNSSHYSLWRNGGVQKSIEFFKKH